MSVVGFDLIRMDNTYNIVIRQAGKVCPCIVVFFFDAISVPVAALTIEWQQPQASTGKATIRLNGEKAR